MTHPTHNPVRFQWHPNRGVLAFVAIFLPLTITLGFWQLSRAEEKQQVLEEFRAREFAIPEPLASLSVENDHLYRVVYAQGEFENEHSVLLENRIRHGKPGFEVVTLFHPEGEVAPVWVNRGWIAGSLNRDILPAVPDISGTRLIRGYLYRPLKEPFVVGEEVRRARWPQVLQNLDLNLLNDMLAIKAFPYQLRLDSSSAGALETGWPVVNVQPEKHHAYAVQWFAMALALVLLGLFASSNLGKVLFGDKLKNNSEQI